LNFIEKIPILQVYFLFLLEKIMAKLKIETGTNNTTLRSISSNVGKWELLNYGDLIQNMLKHIKNPDNGWVWLAAPQVWVNKRIIVVSLMRDYDDENYKTIPLINPEIIEHSLETCNDKEGCLSVPWESGDVKRWVWVKVRFLDPKWASFTMKLTDLAARIVQHEIDHLDGVLFTDKIEPELLY
jgi:peptide deformylase